MGAVLIDEWVNGQMGGWMDGYKSILQMVKGKPDWLAGQMNEWIDESMDA